MTKQTIECMGIDTLRAKLNTMSVKELKELAMNVYGLKFTGNKRNLIDAITGYVSAKRSNERIKVFYSK